MDGVIYTHINTGGHIKGVLFDVDILQTIHPVVFKLQTKMQLFNLYFL